MADGLSHTHVQAICEDTITGYLWIASKNWLTRYDGYQFKIYGKDKFLDAANQASVTQANVVSNIIQKKNGDLLVATEEGGIFKLDPLTDKFVSYDNNKWFSQRIQRIYEDDLGCFWVGHVKGGVEVWNKNLSERKDSIPTGYVNNIYEDSLYVWVSHNDGLLKYDKREKDDEKREEDTTFTFSDKRVPDKRVSAVTEFGNDMLLVGTNFGLYFLNKEKGTSEKAFFKGLTNNSIYVKDILRIKDFIFIGTTEGLYIYSVNNSECESIQAYENQKGNLTSPIITCFGHSKKAEILWVGLLHSGMDKLYLNKPIFKYRTDYKPTVFADSGKLKDREKMRLCKYESKESNPNTINVIYWDEKRSTYWVGFENGEIVELDKDGNFNKTWNIRRSITGIIKNIDETLILSTWDDGLYHLKKGEIYHNFHPGSIKFHESKKEPLKKTNIQHMIKDSRNRIWLATTDGVVRIEKGKQDTVWQIADESRIWFLFEDKGETMWAGTHNGLAKKEANENTFSVCSDTVQNEVIIKNHISFIAQAGEDSLLWVATHGGGVSLFNKNSMTVINTYTKKGNGLPSDVIRSLAFNKDNNLLWIATDAGLCYIEPKKMGQESSNTAKAIIFNKTQGIIPSGEYQIRSFCRGMGGELWFGGVDGLNIIDGNEKDSIQKYKITITDFWLRNKENEEREDTLIRKETNKLNDIVNIKLNRGDQISMQVAVIDFRYNSDYKYDYFVKEECQDWNIYSFLKYLWANFSPWAKQDISWKSIDEENRILDLRYLNSGKHTVTIRANTNYKKIDERNISLDIKCPWWQHLLFWVIIIMIVILFFRFLVKYKKEAKKAEKEKKKAEEEKNVLDSALEAIDNIFISTQEIETMNMNEERAVQKLVRVLFKKLNPTFNIDVLGVGISNFYIKEKKKESTEEEKLKFLIISSKGEEILYEHPLTNKKNKITLCFRNKEKIIYDGYDEDYNVEKILSESYEIDTVSKIYFPLYDNDKPMGVIMMQSFKEKAFKEKKKLIEHISFRIEVALIKLLREIKKYETLLMSDTFNSILFHDVSPIIGLRNRGSYLSYHLREVNEYYKKDEEKMKEHLNQLKVYSDRLKFIFENLDYHDDKQIKKLPLEDTDFELQELFAHLEYLASDLIDVKIKFNEANNYRVHADKRLIEIVLRNLIQNATNAKVEGRQHTISVSASEKDDFICVSVEDTGKGMSENVKNKIFNVKERIAEKRGMGLWICQYIMKLHDEKKHKGCRIWVEKTKEGEGSTFCFTIEKASL